VHQLCFYADALAAIQGELPKQVHVVLGDGTRETLATNDLIHFSRETLAAVESYATSGDTSGEYPWPCEALEMSGLADEAEAIWRADDHLTLIAGATRKQIEKLSRYKITTCKALAAADPRSNPGDIAPTTFERLVRQARLQKSAEPTWELLPPENKRGLALLQKPSPGDIFYDIEGDPLFDHDGSLEYLHGLWWIDEKTNEEVFTPLWSHDREAEKAAFEQLIEVFIARRAAHPGMHIYHYAPYETTALKRLARTYATCEEELDDLLRNDVFIDLYQVVRQSLQASVESYSIKSMERFYMDARQADVKEGGASIVEYERFREIADTPEGQAILDSIGAYNEEDCKSTYLLYEWLRERRREAVTEFGWVGEMEPARDSEDKANASPMSGEPSPAEKHRAVLLLARQKLELAADAETDPDRAHSLRLLGELILFNIREAKSQ
ncbi:MAG: TM0106 family RecB-like putative nuclease, partial [Solirubrobacterales bacterium]